MIGTGGSSGAEVVVRGCSFPLRLAYDVDNHIWYETLASGDVRVGMTPVGAALASYRIFAVTPRRVGRDFEAGTSIATIESSKWVGPARITFDGTITAANDALTANPGRLAVDPYGDGWLVVVKPKIVADLARLVPGERIADAYTHWMDVNNFPGCEPPAD